ncbi:MAG: aldehyde dehydrogenase family protein [Actinobacteria bacterium]|nr:aldehyde dehydrogenase family protein [Actinomycetota bacterium]
MSAPDRQGVFVGGAWSTGAGEARPVLDPSNEQPLATVADASAEQVAAAVAAAREAQRDWSLRPAIERGEVLRKLGDLLEANAGSLAETVTAEVGKPAAQAAGEVGFAAAIFRYTAEWARRLTGDVLPSDERDETINVLRVPIGTVAAICAWNFPLALFSRKVAPALLVGNTVVAKPSELTPLAALAATELAVEAGVPAGVLNLVCGGPETGRALVRDPRIGMVTMTGSTRAGRQILADVAENMTRVSLELGGKAPAIVLRDTDLDAAVANVVGARHLNSGQVCTCAEVVYVEHAVADEFAARYAAAVAGLRVGDPREDPDLGPLASAAQLEKVGGAVGGALAAGATALVEGGRLEDRGPGYWFAPVVLRDVDASMPVVADEVFGPVTPLVEVGSLGEAIEHANASPYGLSAYLYTNDYGKAMRAARDLDCGELYINRSIGEALQAHHSGHRQSGMGGEDGLYGLQRYTQLRSVYHHFGAAEKESPDGI